MKRFRATFLLCLLICSTLSVAAEQVSIVTEQSFPMSFTLDGEFTSQVIGTGTELVRLLMAEAGLDYTITMMPWARAVRQATNEASVLIYPLTRTLERESEYQWVGIISQVNFAMVGLSSNIKNLPTSLSAARHTRIGVIRGGLAHNYLMAQGFDNLVITPHINSNLEMLFRDRIDLFVANTSGGFRQLCENLDLDCEDLQPVFGLEDLSNDIYLAFSLQTSDETVSRVSDILEQVKISGEFDEIMSTEY